MKYSSHLMGLFGSAVTENSDSQSAGLPNPNPLVGRECTAGRPREVIYNRLKKEKKESEPGASLGVQNIQGFSPADRVFFEQGFRDFFPRKF